MDSIYIPQLLSAPNQTVEVDIHDYLPELETLTPVQGSVRVAHRGNYLEVAGKAEAIVTLACDRCLQQYNHRLSLDVSELIWLQESVDDVSSDTEIEVPYEDLVETLPPQGYFSPSAWLYEQLCLEIPQRKLCDKKCPGIKVENQQSAGSTKVDHRWASLEALRNHLSN